MRFSFASLISAVIMSFSFSSFNLSRKRTWTKVVEKDYYNYGKPFVELFKDHHVYGPWIDTKTNYQLMLVHKQLHWYFLVKKEGDSPLPYVTIEITTSDMKDLIPSIRNFPSCSDGASDMGTYIGTLRSLCELADRVVEEMESYNLFTRNCQNFCIELLKKMGKYDRSRIKPTFRKDVDDHNFDLLEIIFPKAPPEHHSRKIACSRSQTPTSQPKNKTRTSSEAGIMTKNTALPEMKILGREPSLSVNDIEALYRILLPLADKWEPIGEELNVNLETFEANYGKGPRNCLREMLRKYLESGKQSWQDLVDIVKTFDVSVAMDIYKKVLFFQQTSR